MTKFAVHKTAGDGAYELYGWFRVDRVEASGDSTIAYVPDSVTAGIVARAMEAVAWSPTTPFGYMCGTCFLSSANVKEIVEHECPGPPPRPADDDHDSCPECGREYEEES